MSDLRIVIIDDDSTRLESISDIIPDYIQTDAYSPREGVLDLIRKDGADPPDLVILDGDDPKSFGLYVYDWMVNKSGDEAIAATPVIVMTDDEFSEKSLEFLEIGDVTFYEGAVDEERLFDVITEAIEAAEFAAEPEEAVYEETKSIDRLIGHTVPAPDGDGKQRAVVLDMETRARNLEAALERGQQRVRQIRELLENAQKPDGVDDDDDVDLYFTERNRREKRNRTEYRQPAVTDTTPVRNVEIDERVGRIARDMQAEAQLSGTQARKRLDANAEDDVARTIDALRQKAASDPSGAYSAQGVARMEDRPKNRLSSGFDHTKMSIAVVDDDVKTRKLCTLFLTRKYNVVAFDSGIKAIDFIVRTHIDLLIINPVLTGMSGLATLASIRMQPGCANIAVMFIVDERYTGPHDNLAGPHVYGILNKPVSQGKIVEAVDGFFER